MVSSLLGKSLGLLGNSRRYLLNTLDTPAVILIYHRVTHLSNDPQLLSVSPENFYEQVGFLQKRYALLGIEEFSDQLLRRKRMPRHAVILTFDDGYADNCLEALPILESLNSQALFYITTSNINTTHELWWDELEKIFMEDTVLPPTLEIRKNDTLLSLPTGGSRERVKIYSRIHLLLKYTPPVERNEIIDNLLSWAGLPKEGRPTHRLMTTDELLKMASSKSAVIGAHTHNHPVLSILPYGGQAEEINLSKKILEDTLQKKIEHFSYPYGRKKDFNRDSIQACEEAGFKLVCSNFYGQVHRWSDPMQLPRILVRNWDRQLFSEYLSKFFRY